MLARRDTIPRLAISDAGEEAVISCSWLKTEFNSLLTYDTNLFHRAGPIIDG